MTLYTAFVIGVLVMLAMSIMPAEASVSSDSATAPQRQSHFMALSDLSHFTAEAGDKPGLVRLTSPEMNTLAPWDQVIVSWNAELPVDTAMKLEARAIYANRATKYYTMALWSPDSAKHRRESVKGQTDADGNVQTDTLVLKQPCSRLQLRITLGQSVETFAPLVDAHYEALNPEVIRAQYGLKLLALNFYNSQVKTTALEPNRAAWGKVIAVPERSQVSYQGGAGWCSPTCVSMNLAHWAKVLNRTELDKDVPDVAGSVYDKTWGGTGNWIFNTAFAGAFPGLRAYVTRFSDVSELEDWIVAGIPVILSVSYDRLKGKAQSKDSGHLIMCVGFTEQGDIIVNDPWARLEKGETVRKTFPRKNLIAGWGHSKNTVYLIYPENATLPHDRFGHWDS